MYIPSYFKERLWVVLLAFAVAAGYVLHKEGGLFDTALIAVISAVIIYCRKNYDILTALMVVLVAQIFLWIFFSVNTKLGSVIYWEVFLYVLSGGALWRCINDSYVALLIPIFVISIACEFYWAVTGYDAPQISWYWFIISLNLISRWVLLIRSMLVIKYLDAPSGETELDFRLYGFYLFPLTNDLVMLLEYMLRHLFSLELYVVYNLYTPVHHLISVFLMIIVVVYGHTSKRKQSLRA